MKKNILSIAILSLLIMTGCASKASSVRNDTWRISSHLKAGELPEDAEVSDQIVIPSLKT